VDRVDAGSRLVTKAGTTMADIVASVHKVSQIIGEISAASGEQSQGIGLVNGSVNQLEQMTQQMTQQNAALVGAKHGRCRKPARAGPTAQRSAAKLQPGHANGRLVGLAPPLPLPTAPVGHAARNMPDFLFRALTFSVCRSR
jgi:hypothetical protein